MSRMSRGDEVIANLSVLIRNPRAPSSVDVLLHVVSDDCDQRRFKAQFLGIADDLTPLNLEVAELRASEVSAAMWEAICMAWPLRAIGFRLLDVRDQIVRRPTRS
jgi:hypothetical protein